MIGQASAFLSQLAQRVSKVDMKETNMSQKMIEEKCRVSKPLQPVHPPYSTAFSTL